MHGTRSGPSSDPAANADPTGSAACANCDAELAGRFCSHCGQEAKPIDPPLRTLLADWLDGFLAFDARVVRTLRPLALRPGFLTVEYLSGRRVRYVPPLKLYLFASFVMFLVLALTGSSMVHEADEGRVVTGWQFGSAAPADGSRGLEWTVGGAEDGRGDGEATEGSDGAVERWLDRAAADPERLDGAIRSHLPKAMFLLVPLFALLLELLYRRRHYAAHLVFSLHFHSFTFLAIAIGSGLDALLGQEIFGGLAVLALLWQLGVGLRRVYGEGRGWTFVKATLLVVIHTVSLVVVLFGALLLAASSLD